MGSVGGMLPQDNVAVANDRLFIRCKYCHHRRVLWKYYPSENSGYLPNAGHLELFIASHLQECHPRGWDVNLGDEPGFTIHTEGADYDAP